MHIVSRLAIWLSLIVTSILAFQLCVAVDEEKPLGSQTAFEVTLIGTQSKAEAIEAISAAARECGCNIYKVQADPDRSLDGRILYTFVGNDKTLPFREGDSYPEFSSQAVTTAVRSADELTTEDLRGVYATDADSEQLNDILEHLKDAQISAQERDVGPLVLMLYAVGQGNLMGAIAVTIMALCLAVVYSVTRNRKIHVLRELFGHRRLANLGAELCSATKVWAIGLAGVVVLGAPFIGFYNHFAQIERFAKIFGIACVVFYGLLMLIITVGVLSLPRADVRSVLQGEQAALRIGVLSAVVQIAVLAVVAATTTASITRIGVLNESLESSKIWNESGSLYALRLSVTGTSEGWLQAAPGFAATVREMEASHQVVLAGYALGVEGSEVSTTGDGDENALVVNDEYLQRQRVLDVNGERIKDVSLGKDKFTLIVPDGYDGDVDQLLSDYADYFRSECSDGQPGVSCDPQGSVVRSASGQSIFGYNGTWSMPLEDQADPFLSDPVLVVVSADSGLLSPAMYVSYASCDDLFFTDPEALRAALDKQEDAWDTFQGIDNAADGVATAQGIAERQLRMDTFSVVLGWGVLALTCLVMVTVYCDRRLRAMFVQLVHGRGFWSRHWGYLTWVVALSGLGVGLALVAGGISLSVRDLAVAGSFIAAQFAIAVAVIRLTENRLRADFIKR